MRTPRQTVHRWILGISVVLVLLLVCAVSLFFVFLPGFLGQTVAGILREKGFRVERLQFEQAGLTGSRLGRGGLGYHDQALEWESIGLSYGPLRLLGGRVDEVTVAAPSLRLRIPELPPRGDSAPQAGDPVVPPGAAGTAPAGGDPADPVADIPIQTGPEPFSLNEFAGNLPFSDAVFNDGKLAVEWHGRTILHADWAGGLKGGPDPFEAELRAEGVIEPLNREAPVSARPIAFRDVLARGHFGDGGLQVRASGAFGFGRWRVDAVHHDARTSSLTWALMDSPDQVALTGSVGRAGDALDLVVDGTLPLGWVNALVNWWQGDSALLSGSGPRIEAQLAGSGYLLKGYVRVLMESLNVALAEDGPILEGISGDTRFRVNGLPGTDGRQQLRIESLTTGKVRLENLLLEWALPTIRHFRLEEAVARLGQGRVVVDPFTTDPMTPVVSTRIRFEQIAGGQFLEWLGERRFAIEGTVSGQIGIKWQAGVLHIGDAELRMDSAATINRLRFSDKSFLEEQFASMAGVPDDLKEPFLATLLSDGIRISDLTLALVPLPESREVALRLKLSGETRSEAMEVPIAGLVINNVISETDLAELLGLFGPVKFLSQP